MRNVIIKKTLKIWYDCQPMNTFRSKLPDGFNLPKRLARLSELAYNLWWTWQPEAGHLFGLLDFDLWERLGHNPIRMLREVGRPRLNQAAKDKEYLAVYDKVFAQFDSYMAESNTWTSQAHPELNHNQDAVLPILLALR